MDERPEIENFPFSVCAVMADEKKQNSTAIINGLFFMDLY
jgi:hypothetical protein